MEEQNHVEEQQPSHIKKYWWFGLAAILIAVGVAGITYLSLMQSQSQNPANNNAKPATTTPTSQTASEMQKIENEQKNLDQDMAAIDKDLNDINTDESSEDDVPAL
jgi:uncharacterized protein HemX